MPGTEMRTQVTMQDLGKVFRYGFAGLILAGLLGMVGATNATAQSKKTPPKAAPKAAPAAKGVAKPGGSAGGVKPGGAAAGGMRANGASGSHGVTANGGGRAAGGAGGEIGRAHV